MKLYKGDKIMQNVDKHQVDDCLAAGWSRTKVVPVSEKEESGTEKPTKKILKKNIPKTKIIKKT